MTVEYSMGWLKETMQGNRLSKTDRDDELQEPIYYDIALDSCRDVLKWEVKVYIVEMLMVIFIYCFCIC